MPSTEESTTRNSKIGTKKVRSPVTGSEDKTSITRAEAESRSSRAGTKNNARSSRVCSHDRSKRYTKDSTEKDSKRFPRPNAEDERRKSSRANPENKIKVKSSDRTEYETKRSSSLSSEGRPSKYSRSNEEDKPRRSSRVGEEDVTRKLLRTDTEYGSKRPSKSSTNDGTRILLGADIQNEARRFSKAGTEDESRRSSRASTDDGPRRSSKARTEGGSRKSPRASTDDGSKRSSRDGTEDGTSRPLRDNAEDGPRRSSRAITVDGSRRSSKAATEVGSRKSPRASTDDGSRRTSRTNPEDGSRRTSRTNPEDGPRRSSRASTDDGSRRTSRTTEDGSKRPSKAGTEVESRRSSKDDTEGETKKLLKTSTNNGSKRSSKSGTENEIRISSGPGIKSEANKSVRGTTEDESRRSSRKNSNNEIKRSWNASLRSSRGSTNYDVRAMPGSTAQDEGIWYSRVSRDSETKDDVRSLVTGIDTKRIPPTKNETKEALELGESSASRRRISRKSGSLSTFNNNNASQRGSTRLWRKGYGASAPPHRGSLEPVPELPEELSTTGSATTFNNIGTEQVNLDGTASFFIKDVNSLPEPKPPHQSGEAAIVWVVGPVSVGKRSLCEALRAPLAATACVVEVLHWPLLLKAKDLPHKPYSHTSDNSIVSCLTGALRPLLLEKTDCVLLCNFPLNLNQALMFQKRVREADAILWLAASEETLLERLSAEKRFMRPQELHEKVSDHLMRMARVFSQYGDRVVQVNADQAHEAVVKEAVVILEHLALIHPKERRTSSF